MADAAAIIQQRLNKINAIIQIGCETILGKYIKESLTYYLYETFYRLGYCDSEDLANSITVKVEPSGVDSFLIEVYFDSDKINHTSIFGSESLGIQSGENVYSVNWINDGKTFILGSNSVRMEDVGKTPQFLEKTVEDINNNQHIINEFKTYLKKNGIDIT